MPAGTICASCGEYMEEDYDPQECPNLENLKWGCFF